jgi:aldose 1-epimerase
MKSLVTLLIAASAVTLLAEPSKMPSSRPFSHIELYHLQNSNGMSVSVTNYGAIITSIKVPDRKGEMADVALGYDSLEKYVNAVDKPYFGAVVGRYGNRIAAGKFTLDGQTYQLAKNDNNVNHLHGGKYGFDKVIWNAEPFTEKGATGLRLTYHSKDGEEGYPGNVDLSVTYTLKDNNDLVVDYKATSDKATPINLTQHTYFNLKGEGKGDILDHVVQLNAPEFTPIDPTAIPSGEIRSVKGTPFDFTTAKKIGQDINSDDEQLKNGLGYDHNFVLDASQKVDGLTKAAFVSEPTSGRTLEVLTTEPGVQFYSGNYLDGRLVGKSGQPYIHRGGFALETQHFPDSPNHSNFPNTILRPGETLTSQTIFRFGVEK